MSLARARAQQPPIDLGEVDFCDSSGLSALLIAERKMKEHGGTVKLVHVHKKVSSLQDLPKLEKIAIGSPTAAMRMLAH